LTFGNASELTTWISTVPAACAGMAVMVMCVAFVTVNATPAEPTETPSTFTSLAPVKFEPTMTTLLPPAMGPAAGERLVTTGTPAADVCIAVAANKASIATKAAASRKALRLLAPAAVCVFNVEGNSFLFREPWQSRDRLPGVVPPQRATWATLRALRR
jgi:hypothetical protein